MGRTRALLGRLEADRLGHWPDSLSVDDVRHGQTNRRNLTLSEHTSRLLPSRGLGSGIPRALDDWPQIEFIDGPIGNPFTTRAQRPQSQWVGPGGPVTPQVAPQVEQLLRAKRGEHTRQPLRSLLGLADREHFRKAYLPPALATGPIEPTLPDKPNSRRQKYRLTAQGKAWMK